jgi:hypothetical protein
MPAGRNRTTSVPVANELALWGVLLLALPAHLLWMHLSIWLDEAWVANSVLAPSLTGMFYYGNWVQSTPALPLLLMRGCVALFGASEISLRIVHWIAGALSAVLFLAVVRRLFPLPFSALGVTLFATNYWAIKYGQQVKQYTTDLLASCVFIALIWRVQKSGLDRPSYILFAVFGAVSTLLAWPAAFWLPSVVLCVLFQTVEPGGLRSWRAHLRWAGLAAILGLSFVLNYVVFIRHNVSPELVQGWSGPYRAFLSDGTFRESFGGFLANVSQLLLPRTFWWSAASAYVLAGIGVVGAARSLVGALRGDRRAVAMFLTGPLPILIVSAASMLRRYPLIGYPRLILWMLPMWCLLVCYSLEKPLAWIEGRFAFLGGRALPQAVVGCCVLLALLTDVALGRAKPDLEQNREAMTHLARSWKTGDRLFVHGGVSEQFYLYERLLHWFPDAVYLGNTEWPCCSLGKEKRVSNPRARTMSDDIEFALAPGLPGRMWVFSPAGAERHWSAGRVTAELEQLPGFLASKGCRMDERGRFGYVLVESFVCR